VKVPPDFVLYLYRKEMGLTWGDLTGQWPQPPWRTYQDLWYQQIAGEAHTVKAKLEQERRERAAAQGTE
jgi:hypothetical protein